MINRKEKFKDTDSAKLITSARTTQSPRLESHRVLVTPKDTKFKPSEQIEMKMNLPQADQLIQEADEIYEHEPEIKRGAAE